MEAGLAACEDCGDLQVYLQRPDGARQLMSHSELEANGFESMGHAVGFVRTLIGKEPSTICKLSGWCNDEEIESYEDKADKVINKLGDFRRNVTNAPDRKADEAGMDVARDFKNSQTLKKFFGDTGLYGNVKTLDDKDLKAKWKQIKKAVETLKEVVEKKVKDRVVWKQAKKDLAVYDKQLE